MNQSREPTVVFSGVVWIVLSCFALLAVSGLVLKIVIDRDVVQGNIAQKAAEQVIVANQKEILNRLDRVEKKVEAMIPEASRKKD